ncbi:hypothetical protein [Mesorhizobium sp. M1A.F.Ca.ET.072.01.1.1]|nr:hypothetical protein [Mesorhizobium sp. M1A.F.Ca.ET.072.01.1.1]
MRPILLIVAALAAFFIWDGVANKRAYRIALMKTSTSPSTSQV